MQQLGPGDIAAVTAKTLRISAERILEDSRRRQTPRYRLGWSLGGVGLPAWGWGLFFGSREGGGRTPSMEA